MNFSKIVFVAGILLFAGIGTMAMLKHGKKGQKRLDEASPLIQPVEVVPAQESAAEEAVQEKETAPSAAYLTPIIDEDVPQVDNVHRFFSLGQDKYSFVETVTYRSRVDWIKGRPAWLADYAAFYKTSRHFIARSLNRNLDYFTQKVSTGDRFNVIARDRDIRFHLLVDLSRLKMWFYTIDGDTGDCELVKTYTVGVGRPDERSPSGSLTPTGKYTIGEKVAIYKPGVEGFFQDKKEEMIQIFGTRWLPFDRELENCTAPSKGFGLHGAPWLADNSGSLHEDATSVGTYSSDGCIRLHKDDVEELFAIIISRPTTIEIVKAYQFDGEGREE